MSERPKAPFPDPKKVFVVHGRNENLRQDLFAFLRAIGLEPIEWSQAIGLTGKAAPYISEILDAAFRKARALVVLMSPEDQARLRPELQKPDDPIYEKEFTAQPRQNVLFEAGLAFGFKPSRTILVKVGELRPFSDIYGRHEVRLTNDVARRQDLANRLRSAGCAVRTDGADWLSIGNFDLQTMSKSEVTKAEEPKTEMKRLSIADAETIALAHVRKEKPEATNISVDSRKLEKNVWHIDGHYPVSGRAVAGTMEFKVMVDAQNGEIVSSDFRAGFMAGVG